MTRPLPLTPGQVYQECPIQPGGRRIIITQVMTGPRWQDARSVQVTNLDGSRRRWIKPHVLHDTPTTTTGRTRRQGYAFITIAVRNRV